MPRLKDSTYQQQARLAKYTRDGEQPALKGVTEGRLHHYRRLVMNVVRDALRSTYPLTVNLLGQKEWDVLCQEFFEQHACQHPQVWRMPEELIDFVDEERTDLLKKYPQLNNLLQLEWLEAEYYMMPDQPFDDRTTQDPVHQPWNINPESEIIRFDFPVHTKNARFISRTDEAVFFCLIFRQPTTGKVRFMNLSPFLAWLLSTLSADPSASPADLYPLIEKEFKVSANEALGTNISDFFQLLAAEEMVR